MPIRFGSAGSNAFGPAGGGSAGAVELRQVDEEALNFGSDSDEEKQQQQGLVLGNAVANALGAVGAAEGIKKNVGNFGISSP